MDLEIGSPGSATSKTLEMKINQRKQQLKKQVIDVNDTKYVTLQTTDIEINTLI